MRKVVVGILVSVMVIILDVIFIGFIVSRRITLNSINILSYDEINNTIKIEITRNKMKKYFNKFECIAAANGSVIKESGIGDKCELDISLTDNYKIYLKNKFYETGDINLFQYLRDNSERFSFNKKEIYLTIDEKISLDISKELNYPKEILYDFIIENEDIVKIEDGYIIGLTAGETKIVEKNSNSSIKVIVTDLITNYKIAEKKKEVVPCNEYTKEEAELLDNYLAYKVNLAGYGTRAGVVEAGRFLTLQFKYRIPYFYENGRLSESGTHITDGEGRYYHEGLYLSNDKKKSITDTYKGPAIWGCPLTNLNPDEKHGYYVGKKKPNGLDCSGFVTWAFKNGGTNPGDIGAGETPDQYQMTDTGKFVLLDDEVIKSDKIRAGDLFNFWGHIALIIGVDDENYYVAESLPYLGGVVARTYKKTKVNKTFTHVVFMDDFYELGDGNYTAMWI